jgi:hypothetical protein
MMPQPRRPKGRYYRVSPQFWHWVLDNDWNDDVIIVALYLLTCEHRNTEGLFRFSKRVGAEDLRWTDRRFEKSFEVLVVDGFVEYDERARVCWIVNALEWQAPTNPNQIKGAVRGIVELPGTGLMTGFRKACAEFCPALLTAVDTAVGTTVPTPVPTPVRNTPSPSPSPSPQSFSSTPTPPVADDVEPSGKRAA